MKKLLAAIIAAALLSLLAGCSKGTGPSAGDGRARPSVCGALKVIEGRLCSNDGEPVMLRGVSLNGLITSESFINEQLFAELAEQGVNLIRLPVYTYGVGVIGYCTNGDKDRHKQDIARAAEYAAAQDIYVIIDWHILSDGDPNTYIDEAKRFFAEMAETYCDNRGVLYEICNEPNGVDWQAVKRYADVIIPIIRERDPDSLILVGDPDWSKDLKSVAADPLDYENVMYSLHFYSASHGADIRNGAEELIRAGLPVFVTEFGVTASSGDLPRDTESADEWIEMLERENVSYCMWALSKAREAASMIRAAVPKYSGFETADYTETGLWLLDTLAKYADK